MPAPPPASEVEAREAIDAVSVAAVNLVDEVKISAGEVPLDEDDDGAVSFMEVLSWPVRVARKRWAA